MNKKACPKKNLYFISYGSSEKASRSLLQHTPENTCRGQMHHMQSLGLQTMLIKNITQTVLRKMSSQKTIAGYSRGCCPETRAAGAGRGTAPTANRTALACGPCRHNPCDLRYSLQRLEHTFCG
jgi:hypothetical protein